jgi:hypothetical protein
VLQIKAHSARTFLTPRNRNWRKPRACSPRLSLAKNSSSWASAASAAATGRKASQPSMTGTVTARRINASWKLSLRTSCAWSAAYRRATWCRRPLRRNVSNAIVRRTRQMPTELLVEKKQSAQTEPERSSEKKTQKPPEDKRRRGDPAKAAAFPARAKRTNRRIRRRLSLSHPIGPRQPRRLCHWTTPNRLSCPSRRCSRAFQSPRQPSRDARRAARRVASYN